MRTMTDFIVFLLAGQSNMAGRGGVHRMPDGTKALREAELANLPQVENGVKIVRFSAAEDWEIAREPMHKDIDTR